MNHLSHLQPDSVLSYLIGFLRFPPPAASLRIVSVPPHVLPGIERHLRAFVGPEPSSPRSPARRAADWAGIP